MTHWIYIYKDKEVKLQIALSADADKLKSNPIIKDNIVYLWPFELPFDALAHKHLLDSLSKESVMHWIEKHTEETKIWLQVVSEK